MSDSPWRAYGKLMMEPDLEYMSSVFQFIVFFLSVSLGIYGVNLTIATKYNLLTEEEKQY